MASVPGFTSVQAGVIELVKGGSVRTRRGVYWWVGGEPAESHIGRTLRELRREGVIDSNEGGEPDEWDAVLVVLTVAGRARMGEGEPLGGHEGN